MTFLYAYPYSVFTIYMESIYMDKRFIFKFWKGKVLCVCDYAIKVKIWPYGRIPRSDLRKLNKILFVICKKHISV